ncbi:DNA repair protein RecO [Verminephrobacter eiseniae]|uniref:DNA repair protein RecO n=1 Tax=Verminephrobacter eiseniae (strain EF01-2) TaxID=391735 RepID=RECO_VEREI|nr:DNA repair protein RecO [Verminephrobacter eiseniae]A1WKD3.1 RecName: Full=DNA repair protein RecO; AltName: Full=Recombination protein O [Verminephrobacter eiseniae EF01-2]KAB7597784.1 DNA repair protein RecO [Verminephrobacter sp. Larva24]ABM58090.1 DNA repair protein RecO [Verminephrobacter eiseniae EF01-2]MCW5232533.1 DNA repair protein RecO [Verminephrobacter eiseniae]MCW5263241.1 DNA repair protein RecO [Verminephrobacter eiseniae]MCW5283694.1 DNA repair protein RecO [Verminephrobact
MAAAKRIADEPAFVLHSYDWSESSLILEVFCRHQGRVALVAKGAKKPSSNFRPVLLPLQPLWLSYALAADGNADIHTLKGAEWVGGHVMPTGDALLSGLYLNELLLRLLARSDPHAALFDAYTGVVRVLASEHGDALEPVLRSFELLLLRAIGLLPSLAAQTMTLAPLQADTRYTLVPEGGLRAAAAAERAALPGHQWQVLQHALDDAASHQATVRACAPVCAELKPQLRTLLQYHCGSPMLRTRQLMIDLQAL